jgi:hypothetical protein
MMRFGSFAALVAAAVLALGGCGDDDATGGVTTIRVGALPITDLDIAARDVHRESELSRRYGLLPRALDAREVLAR